MYVFPCLLTMSAALGGSRRLAASATWSWVGLTRRCGYWDGYWATFWVRFALSSVGGFVLDATSCTLHPTSSQDRDRDKPGSIDSMGEEGLWLLLGHWHPLSPLANHVCKAVHCAATLLLVARSWHAYPKFPLT